MSHYGFLQSCLLAALLAGSLSRLECVETITLVDQNSPIEQISTDQELIPVTFYNQAICVEMPYSTDENFFGKRLYSSATCLVRENVAKALASVQEELLPYNLGIKVWDAYRPLSVEQEMGALLEVDHFEKEIKFIGLHSRGVSVDVTLVSDTGMEVLMPTGYDYFGEKAKRNYTDLSEDAIFHRMLLEVVMRKHGFIPSDLIWWHFDYEGALDYPQMDRPFLEDAQ